MALVALWRNSGSLDAKLDALEREVAPLRLPPGSAVTPAIERFRADAAALRFHLHDDGAAPRVVVVLGGTGTGKSTLVNRLLQSNISAASFRRTFTAGAVAVARERSALPDDWLGLEHELLRQEQLPARGEVDRLVIVPVGHELTRGVTLIDTPDLDGDQPAHHAQADRAFRWAQGLVFLVTPEKYQMTELLPYYRLARRYAIPSLFVMNKAEEPAVVEDYARRLAGHLDSVNGTAPAVYAVPRDDAAYEPAEDIGLPALRSALSHLQAPAAEERTRGLAHRAADLAGRLQDQILSPLSDARKAADRLSAALRAMETPPATVDVNPLTRQLQRRLQQRSILYLIGPGRMLDRVRQVPMLLARLPRATWDLIARGRTDATNLEPGVDGQGREVPDFRQAMIDQFVLVQSRIEDVLRTDPAGQRWLEQSPDDGWSAIRMDPSAAGAIAQEELDALRTWLEKKWNATPRDTAILKKLLKYLPGGEKLTQWSEAAPYLLTIIVATHHAFFGHIDLMILGGYSLATWLSERLSNEVAARTRQTNRRLAERFEQLAHEQIERAIAFVDSQAPQAPVLQRLRRLAEAFASAAPAGEPR